MTGDSAPAFDWMGSRYGWVLLGLVWRFTRWFKRVCVLLSLYIVVWASNNPGAGFCSFQGSWVAGVGGRKGKGRSYK